MLTANGIGTPGLQANDWSPPARPANTNTLRQPGASPGWQRKGTAAAASAMPRPFDQPDDIPATSTTPAPWAEPVSNDGAAEAAPDPAVPVGSRLRHVVGSVNSPRQPLTWRLKSTDGASETAAQGVTVTRSTATGATVIRRTTHLTDTGEEAANDGSAVAPLAAPEFNAPQDLGDSVRTAQGKGPTLPDPAVPVPPPTDAENLPPVEPPSRLAPAKPLTPSGKLPPLSKPPGADVAPAPKLQPQPMSPRRREADLQLLRDVPCDRMYGPDKNRNCCAEELVCGEARRRVKQLTINTIKVDITPTCNLAGEWSDAPETKCGWQLELSPVRPWKNRLGQQVAHGRFSGFTHARVIITDENGETTRLRMHDLSEDDRCFVTAWCGLPFECGLVDEPLLARNWQPLTMTWKASALCHKPLYFEDTQLERYGHTSGPILQPFVSGAHFFANIALLPYNMGIHPMNECQYALGYYRPGVCAPRIIPPFPLSVRGGLMEAGAMVGGVYLFP